MGYGEQDSKEVEYDLEWYWDYEEKTWKRCDPSAWDEEDWDDWESEEEDEKDSDTESQKENTAEVHELSVTGEFLKR